MSTITPFSGAASGSEAGEKPLYTGFLRGYRIWKISFGSNQNPIASLRSTSHSEYAWTPRTIEIAACSNEAKYRNLVNVLLGQESVLLGRHARASSVSQRKEIESDLRYTRDRIGRLVADLRVMAGHPSPSAKPPCMMCGLYAFHHPRHFEENDGTLPTNFSTVPEMYLLGSVKATGTIVVGSRGMRAEKMQVEALTIGFNPYEDVDSNSIVGVEWRVKTLQHLVKFGEQFEVPVYAGMSELLHQHPPTPLEGVGDTSGWEALPKAAFTVEEERPAPAVAYISTASTPVTGNLHASGHLRTSFLDGVAWITDLTTGRRKKVFGVNISFREDYSDGHTKGN